MVVSNGQTLFNPHDKHSSFFNPKTADDTSSYFGGTAYNLSSKLSTSKTTVLWRCISKGKHALYIAHTAE